MIKYNFSLPMKTGYKVLDAMTKNPIIISPDATIKSCAELMKKEKISGLPVVENDKLVGVITEHDIVRKIVAEGKSVKTKVKDAMASRVITVKPNEDIYEALIKMRDNGIRHLPVVYKRKLLGLLTVKDILKIEPQLFDLIVETYEIRETYRKPIGNKEGPGICQVCGKFSTTLYEIDGVLMCEDCKRDALKNKNKKSI